MALSWLSGCGNQTSARRLGSTHFNICFGKLKSLLSWPKPEKVLPCSLDHCHGKFEVVTHSEHLFRLFYPRILKIFSIIHITLRTPAMLINTVGLSNDLEWSGSIRHGSFTVHKRCNIYDTEQGSMDIYVKVCILSIFFKKNKTNMDMWPVKCTSRFSLMCIYF